MSEAFDIDSMDVDSEDEHFDHANQGNVVEHVDG
jgi:hypothetical protein